MDLEKEKQLLEKEAEQNLNELKLIIKVILIVAFLALSFTLIISLVKADNYNFYINNLNINSPSDLDYTFASNQLGNSSLSFNNLAHYDKFAKQNYSATIDFLNETETTQPKGFYEYSGSSTTWYVLDNYTSHNKVLRMVDDSVVKRTFIYRDDLHSYGSIEFYYLVTDITKPNKIWIEDDPIAHIVFGLKIESSTFQYFDDSGWNVFGNTPITYQWYHIRFDFESTVGNYLGLGQYQYELYLDGISIGVKDFNVNYTVGTLAFATDISATSYRDYIDSIGYNWKNYTIGSNLIPDIIPVSSNLLSNDKYEFNIKANKNPLAYNYDNFGKDYSTNLIDWTIDDPSGTNKVYVQNDYYLRDYGITNTNGLMIEPAFFSTNEGGIENDSMYIESLNYTITYDLRLDGLISHGNDDYVAIYLYGLDGQSILGFRIKENSATNDKCDLEYYFGSWNYGNTYITGTSKYYNLFTFEINPYVKSSHYYYDVNVYLNHSLVTSMTEKQFIHDSIGLTKISLKACSPLYYTYKARIENIAIYKGNISLCRENGFALSYSKLQNWKSYRQNLISLTDINYATVYIYGYSGSWNSYYLTNQENNIYFNNVYKKNLDYDNASLFILNNEYINTSVSYYIKGIKLTESSNTYYASYKYSNMNANFSYFYVSNARCYYIANITNSNREYLQITFDLPAILTVNRSLQFRSKYDGFGYTNFRLNYTDNSGIIFFIASQTQTTNYILEQDDIIDKISFRYDDLDNDAFINFSSIGYLTNVKLLYYPNIEVTINVLTLFDILPALLVIYIIPLFFIKVIGKKGIIPFMMLMVLIAFFTQLIPAWLFFLMFYCIALLYIFTRKENFQE